MNNNIFYIINQTSYNPSYYQTILNFFIKNFSTNSKTKIYLINRPILNERIFVVKYELPVKFNKQTFDVSLLIYFPSSFPLDIEFYLENKINLAINNNYSNEVINRNNLRLNLDFFCNWDSNKLNFSEIIGNLQCNFDASFPVFRSMNSNEEHEGCCILNNIIQEIFLGKCNEQPNSIKNINGNNNINYSKLNDNINGRKTNNSYNPNNNINYNQNYNINANNNYTNINNSYNNNNNNNINNYNNNYKNISNNNNNNNININYNNNNYNKSNNNNNNNNNKKNNDIENDEEMKKNIIEFICNNIKDPLAKKMNELKEKKEQSIAFKQIEINKSKYGSLNNLQNNLNELQKLYNTLNKNENNLKYGIKEIEKNLNKKVTIKDYEKLVNVNYNVMFCSISSKTIDDFLISLKKLYEKDLISFEETKNMIRKFSREIFNLKYKRFKISNDIKNNCFIEDKKLTNNLINYIKENNNEIQNGNLNNHNNIVEMKKIQNNNINNINK